MAENVDKLYSAENLGSGTFNISKPKRKLQKLRLSRVNKLRRQARRASKSIRPHFVGSPASGTCGEATYTWLD